MRKDLVSISIALLVLDAMAAPMLRTLISEPDNDAYLAFRIATFVLGTLNVLIIAAILRQIIRSKGNK